MFIYLPEITNKLLDESTKNVYDKKRISRFYQEPVRRIRSEENVRRKFDVRRIKKTGV